MTCSVDGWPYWATLTENRCVSSEDEGLTDKHYLRTSATCHNTGHIGAPPCIHQLHQKLCVSGAPTSAGRPFTHHSTSDTGCREHVWSRHLLASAGPQPPSQDKRENAPVHLKNNSRIAFSLPLTTPHTEEQAHTHTLYHWCFSGALHTTPHITLVLDPSLVDERCLVVAKHKNTH